MVSGLFLFMAARSGHANKSLGGHKYFRCPCQITTVGLNAGLRSLINYYRLNFGETILDVIAAAVADKCGDR